MEIPKTWLSLGMEVYRIDQIFDYPKSEIYYKKYKIYAWYDNKEIVYIGCTKDLKQRLGGHAAEWACFNKDKQKYFSDLVSSEMKLEVKVLYTFNSKMLACFCERLLINFIKNHTKVSIFNKDSLINEEYILNNDNVKSY